MQSIPAERIEPGLLTTDLGTLAAVVDVKRAWSEAEVIRAVEGLLRAYPVLNCRYVTGWWRDRWAADPAPVASIVAVRTSNHLEEDTRRAVITELDPFSARPIRVTALQTGEMTRLIVAMPHLVADGNGVLTTLQELAAQLMGAGRTAPYPMDRSVEQLRVILRAGTILRVLGAMLAETRRILWVPFLRRWAEVFSNPRDDTRGFRRVALTADATRAFADTCKRHGGTVNDGLVAASLSVASRYVDGGRIGSAYTINLRRFLPANKPIVANLSGFDTVIAHAGAVPPAGRIAQVAAVTGEQKERMPGIGSLLLPMVVFGWMPHGAMHAVGYRIKAFMAWQARRMTLITNVGVMDPYVAPFGDLATDAWMAGPFVPKFPGPLAMATSFHGRLSVTISTVPGTDPAAAADFTDYWEDALNSVARSSAEASVSGLRV